MQKAGERTPWYKGKQAKTGNSLGLRFDRALFRSHPEFNGVVQAKVIAPGRMLVVAERRPKAREEADPVIASFLSFLAQDMSRVPQNIAPLDRALVRRMKRLTRRIKTDADEDLGSQAFD